MLSRKMLWGSKALADLLFSKVLYAQELERSSQPVTPFGFLMQLREKYPQFAQQSNTGAYMQQDAEECWTQLLYTLRERLKVGVLTHSKPCCKEFRRTQK